MKKNINLKRKKILLLQLYKIHLFYRLQNNSMQKKIIKKCNPIIVELFSLGIDKIFSDTFLVYGNEFLYFEYGKKLKIKNTT